jgi:hypothetical protein
MATIKRNAKSQVVNTTKLLIVGATKHLPTGPAVSFDGSAYTQDQVTEMLQALVDLRANVDAAKAAVKDHLALEAARAPALAAFSRQFRAFIKAAYANSPSALADFGISPRARVAQTVETKTAAVAKRAATRAARHTMGPKQRLAVKGDVTGVVVSPVTAPVPAVPTPSR